jgi:sulfite exporter TauE/SafE
MVHDKRVESIVAIGSFLAAVGLAFTSLMISEDHDIAAGVLMMCAQFLMLTATIFGIDYKLGQRFTNNTKANEKTS